MIKQNLMEEEKNLGLSLCLQRVVCYTNFCYPAFYPRKA